jgi:hypothetical protein
MAAQPRRRVLGGLVARLIETAFAGSASSMVLSLIEDGRLSDEDARRIRALIDESARKGGKRK